MSWVSGLVSRIPPKVPGLGSHFSDMSPPEVFYKKRCSKKICNIHWKKAVLKSLFNKVAGLKAHNFIKKKLQHRCCCEYYEIFKNNCFEKQQRAAASDSSRISRWLITHPKEWFEGISKVLFIVPKRCFRSWDFFLDIHCWINRNMWLKINLKVYDVNVVQQEFKSTDCLIYSDVKKVWYWNFVKWLSIL